MRLVHILVLLAALLPCATSAQTLKPMHNAPFDGIPIEQAMSTLHVLGKWILPQHGALQVFTMARGHQEGCMGDETDPDRCVTARLYVAAEDSLVETHGLSTQFYPETYFLLRGVNGTGWYLPKGGTLKFTTPDSYLLKVCGSKFTTKLSGGAIVPTTYILKVVRRRGKDKRYSFSATMEQQKNECPADEMFERDENVITSPPAILPGKAPH
jgi:hypothetical protein